MILSPVESISIGFSFRLVHYRFNRIEFGRRVDAESGIRFSGILSKHHLIIFFRFCFRFARENEAYLMIPVLSFLPRITAFALLTVHSLAAYEWGGRVMDDVGRPLAGPRICWLSDTSHCVVASDSGTFRIDLPLSPAAIGRPVSAPGLRVEFVRGTIILHASHASAVSLDWFTPKGRKLRHSVLNMKPDGVDALQGSDWPEASGSLVLLRVSVANTSLIVKVILLGSRPRVLPQPQVLPQPPNAPRWPRPPPFSDLMSSSLNQGIEKRRGACSPMPVSTPLPCPERMIPGTSGKMR